MRTARSPWMITFLHSALCILAWSSGSSSLTILLSASWNPVQGLSQSWQAFSLHRHGRKTNFLTLCQWGHDFLTIAEFSIRRNVGKFPSDMESSGWFEFSQNYSVYLLGTYTHQPISTLCLHFFFLMLPPRMWCSSVIRAGVFDMCSDSYKYVCQTFLADDSLQIHLLCVKLLYLLSVCHLKGSTVYSLLD